MGLRSRVLPASGGKCIKTSKKYEPLAHERIVFVKHWRGEGGRGREGGREGGEGEREREGEREGGREKGREGGSK